MSLTIVNPSAFEMTGAMFESPTQVVDWAAGVCYARAPHLTQGKQEAFIKNLVLKGHMTPLEFVTVFYSSPVGVYPKGLIETDPASPSLPYIREESVRGDGGDWFFRGAVNLRALVDYFNAFPDTYWDGEGTIVPCVLSSLYWKVFGCGPFSFLKGCVKDPGCSEEGIVESLSMVDVCVTSCGVEPPLDPRYWGLERPIIQFGCSRNISHQLVRHRNFSFCQESQRYVDYYGGLSVVAPEAITREGSRVEFLWREHTDSCHITYRTLIDQGVDKQTARGCLSGDTATWVAACADLTNWAWLLHLRSGRGADPEMRRLVSGLKERMLARYPHFAKELDRAEGRYGRGKQEAKPGTGA